MSETMELTAFGPFRLAADQRRLTRAGVPVPLSSRAFDILVLLVENRGRVVGKDEIMTRVWRGMIVEENNLAVQISALRRVLACGMAAPAIMTVPGQGYRFVAALDRDAAPLPVQPEAATAIPVVPAPIAIPAPPSSAPIVPAGGQTRRPEAASRLSLIAGACVLALAGLAIVQARHQAAPPPASAVQAPVPPRLSIAVLPFRDLSDDRCCDYLADAISDDLTTALSLIPGSVVIARESADVFRGHPTPAASIGRSLNVRYLLEGSLRAVDGDFAINAQLIEAATGAHLWAERFTTPRAHLAQAQDAIVRRLTSALGVRLVDIEGARSIRDHPADPDALDLTLRARSVLDRSDTLAGMTQAQRLLEQALARQPDDIGALSELAWLLPRKLHNYVTSGRAADLATARVITARAVALAPRDPSVLAAKAALQAFDGNCVDAEITFQAALEADPGSVRALTGLTVCQFQRGRFAAAAADLDALLRIDPEGPRQKIRFYQMGFAQLMLDRPAEALPWLHRAVAGAPDPLPGAAALSPAEWERLALIAATRLAGDRAGADAQFAAYRAIWPGRSSWTLESRSPRGYSVVPGFRHFLGALQDEGMRRFGDAEAGPSTGPCDPGATGPMPRAVPGIRTIDTAALARLIRDGKPLIADFGVGAAVPAAARLSSLDPASATDMAAWRASPDAARADALVVMGSGTADPAGCEAAVLLEGKGGLPVYWYRGGEEAWAASGLPASDQR